MRKIRILCVGRKLETYLQNGIARYEKKLRRYCNLEIKSLREADYGKGSIELWHQRELQEIQRHLQPRAFQVVCDETGAQLTSREFAATIGHAAGRGYSSIAFIVGGAFGLPAVIKEQSDMRLSLSKMTLTHQMARLFLVEQIYRAFTILNGENYHH